MTSSAQSVTSEQRVGRRGEQKRRWERENRGRCRCGAQMERISQLCQVCRTVEEAQRKARKWDAIRDLWLEGLTLREIGAELGKAWRGVSWDIGDMRAAGVPVPWRYRR